jgi:hypothetical protein
MSGGKRFKFQGSQISLVTGFDENSPSKTISAATKADPAVITVTGHGVAVGGYAVARIRGVGGMTELNDEVFIAVYASANTLTLRGVNSTNYGTFSSAGSIDFATFSNFCELTGYNRQGGSKPEQDATSLCSEAAEYELGLPDFGTTQLDFFFAPRTAIQTAMREFDESGDKLAVKVVLPRSGGEIVQLGFVQQLSEQSAVNGLWTASMTLRNTGRRYDVPAA